MLSTNLLEKWDRQIIKRGEQTTPTKSDAGFPFPNCATNVPSAKKTKYAVNLLYKIADLVNPENRSGKQIKRTSFQKVYLVAEI